MASKTEEKILVSAFYEGEYSARFWTGDATKIDADLIIFIKTNNIG